MANHEEKTSWALHERVQYHAKNLFIPHPGNNHEPQFLRPKRLFLYAAGSVGIKLIILALVVFIPLTAWVTPDIASQQAKKIIELTNDIRANLNIAPLKENPILSEAAYDKVQDMIIGQYFAHINSKQQGLKYWLGEVNYGYTTAGENLAMGFAEPQDVVNAWQNSKTHYRNMVNPVYTEIGVALDSGQYQGYDTTFVAQYFAVPAKAVAQTAPIVAESIVSEASIATTTLAVTPPLVSTTKPIVKTIVTASSVNKVSTTAVTPTLTAIVATPTPTSVLGLSIISSSVLSLGSTSTLTTTTASVTPAAIVNNITLTFVDDSSSDQQKRIVRAEGYLADDVVKAEVYFANYSIALQPDGAVKNKWSGSMIVFGADDKLFNPIVLPTLVTQYTDSSIITDDISWSNIKPVNPSVLDRYFFIKERNAPYISKFFTFSLIIYRVLLILAIFTLLFNVYKKYKTQNYRLIAISIGFIILMTILMLL